MHDTLFTVGPLSVTLLGVFSALGMLAGMYVAGREARRAGWDDGIIYNTILVAIAGAVIGARLYYAAVFAPEAFLSNPLRLFALHEGGLSIQGGLIGGVLGVALYVRAKRHSFWKTADILAPGVILGQAIGRVGCDVFGVEASAGVLWAVNVGGQPLHPVQLYESMLNYLLFLGLLVLRHRLRKDGDLFLVYIMAFAFNRFVVEFYRMNPQAFGVLTVAHVTSVAMFVAAAAVFAARRIPSLRFAGATMAAGGGGGAGFGDDRRTGAPASGRSAAVVAGLMIASVFMYYLLHG